MSDFCRPTDCSCIPGIKCDVKECVSRGITLDEIQVVKISLRALEMKKYLNCISKL